MEISFPRHYQEKAFLADVIRLRDLARLRTRQPLNEVAEVIELRKRLRRADADAVLLLVLRTRQAGGLQFF